MFYVTKINLLSIRYFHSLFSRFQQVLTLFLVWWCWLLCFSVLSFGWIAFFANNRALFVWRMCSTKQKSPVNLWNKKETTTMATKTYWRLVVTWRKGTPSSPYYGLPSCSTLLDWVLLEVERNFNCKFNFDLPLVPLLRRNLYRQHGLRGRRCAVAKIWAQCTCLAISQRAPRRDWC